MTTIYNVDKRVKITKPHPEAINETKQNKNTVTVHGRKCKNHLTPLIGHSKNHEIPLKNQPEYSTTQFIPKLSIEDNGII
tara:strand:+ start:646 stop:885 length:240 start_codon:yes stop_codon:yes gene_type:complete